MKSTIYISIILLTLAICSCKSVKYVPVESVNYDSIYITNTQKDSIYQRDSIYLEVSGDTIYKYRDRYIYKYKTVRDTTNILRTDSIQVPYPVEKELSRWQSFKMEIGGYAIIVLLVVILYFIYKKTK